MVNMTSDVDLFYPHEWNDILREKRNDKIRLDPIIVVKSDGNALQEASNLPSLIAAHGVNRAVQ